MARHYIRCLQDSGISGQVILGAPAGPHSGFRLVLDCFLLCGHVKLRVWYDPSRVSHIQAKAISHQFDRSVQQLFTQDESFLADVTPQSTWDIEQATAWNNEDIPEVVDDCVHYVVTRQAQERPNEVTIDTWDGTFT
ncbi:hypothetical protein BKA59DRAFT_454088 [Fusarium tricinctum]|uniref:Uncharacterized protein n=1 Tax=Fusarium tricinctum TaxID=61284 RepID=A0A8K0RZC3_9HYPO|nr:hypothetical protein BKA59DRAFT_454088 [Fusarium tricinctum]